VTFKESVKVFLRRSQTQDRRHGANQISEPFGQTYFRNLTPDTRHSTPDTRNPDPRCHNRSRSSGSPAVRLPAPLHHSGSPLSRYIAWIAGLGLPKTPNQRS
jgi:hypothetical protein